MKDFLLDQTYIDEAQLPFVLQTIHLIGFAQSLTKTLVSFFTASRDGQVACIRLGNQAQFFNTSEVEEFTGKVKIINNDFSIKLVTIEHARLCNKLLESGTFVKGLVTLSNGNKASFSAYPLVDNGGRVIGGLSFVNPRIDKMEDIMIGSPEAIVTETTYMAMMVPHLNQISAYHPVSYTDGIIILDQEGIILYGNEQAMHLVDLLGFNRQFIGTSVYGSRLKLSFIKQALEKREIREIDEIYDEMVIGQRILPVFSRQSGPRGILVLQDKTLVSQKEKELLVKNSVIKEIHHRVKNNLQTVAGLLRMEARQSDSAMVKKALQEGISRIESMALVHDIVSHYEEDYVNLRSIFDELSRLLKMSMLAHADIVTFMYSGDEVFVRSYQASYISLIINELISNSLEHGIGNNEGHIDFHVVDQGSRVVFVLTDNGKGLPENFDIKRSKRLGLQIIRNLVENELSGHIQMKTIEPHGTEVTIDFMKGD